MATIHPLDILQGYRLGNRQATVELQRTDVPGIHIEFDVFKLVDLAQQTGQAIILTGTAGDGKTYLAYRVMDSLGLDKTVVRQAQASGGYDYDAVFIDLDLSAGVLNDERQKRLYQALNQPERLTLVCANEGKLDELRSNLAKEGLTIPESVLSINLSRRALVNPRGWKKVLTGVLEDPIWQNFTEENSIITHNITWLTNPEIAERLRRYLLLPYLLGEPITIRETLSFLAYALGGGLSAADSEALTKSSSEQILPYLLFNTVFSEPDGYIHGGRATPTEKLLWWLFRFDPAIHASPRVDLHLLINLDKPDELGATPPYELIDIWKEGLVVQTNETSDTEYRRRLARFMRYARRWYALVSEQGFDAYFPFRHFRSYLEVLNSPGDTSQEIISKLIYGLNLLLSGGHESHEYGLKLFHLPVASTKQIGAIYSAKEIYLDEFSLLTDLSDEIDQPHLGDTYLERLPRRLYLQYNTRPEIRLPISLLLYEVLLSAASADTGFPATLWAKEQDTVARFMNQLSRLEKDSHQATFKIFLSEDQILDLNYLAKFQNLKVS